MSVTSLDRLFDTDSAISDTRRLLSGIAFTRSILALVSCKVVSTGRQLERHKAKESTSFRKDTHTISAQNRTLNIPRSCIDCSNADANHRVFGTSSYRPGLSPSGQSSCGAKTLLLFCEKLQLKTEHFLLIYLSKYTLLTPLNTTVLSDILQSTRHYDFVRLHSAV